MNRTKQSGKTSEGTEVSTNFGGYTSLEEAFPHAKPNYIPVGSKVLVQIRTPKKKSAGGIILTHETQEVDQWNTQVAKVIAFGPVAFCNRETLKEWPEGKWVIKDEFVRVPKYGGDRWQVPLKPGDPNTEYALFAVYKDTDIIGIVPDPLSVIAFI